MWNNNFNLKNFVLMNSLKDKDPNQVLMQALKMEMMGNKSMAWQMRQAVIMQMMMSGDMNPFSGKQEDGQYSYTADIAGMEEMEGSSDIEAISGLGELGNLANELIYKE